MLSIDAKLDCDSAVAWQLRQYAWPASGNSSTTFGTLDGSWMTPPVGYHDGSSAIGWGNLPAVNADTSRSGGGNCGSKNVFGACRVHSHPSWDELLDLSIGAQRFG